MFALRICCDKILELLDRFSLVFTLHHGHRLWIEAMGLDARAIHFRPVAGKKPEIAFGDLAAATVAGDGVRHRAAV